LPVLGLIRRITSSASDRNLPSGLARRRVDLLDGLRAPVVHPDGPARDGDIGGALREAARHAEVGHVVDLVRGRVDPDERVVVDGRVGFGVA
jgi:hypothetical protein